MESSKSFSVPKENTNSRFAILLRTSKNSRADDLVSELRNQIPDSITAEIIIMGNLSDSQKNEMPKRIKIIKGDQSRQTNRKYIEKSIPVTYVRDTFGGEKISSVIQAIKHTTCQNIILMGDDSSNPPQLIPKLIETYLSNDNCVVVAQQNNRDGSEVGNNNLNNNMISDELRIIQVKLSHKIKVSLSNYMAFPKSFVDAFPKDEKQHASFLDHHPKLNGYKILVITYDFAGQFRPRPNLISSMGNYAKSVLYYYRHGPKSRNDFTDLRHRNSAVFLSKAIRFYTVGASGLLINYVISTMLTNGILLNLWYMEATLIGILASITSNFFLNKSWTFQDRNFSLYYTLRQFLLFSGISCFAALIQLGLVYIGVEGGSRYWTSLLFSITVASISNFLLNKKLTFHERLWA